MEQIIVFYCFVCFLPAVFGAAMRIALKETRKAYRYTGLSLLLTVAMWVAAWFMPNHGSEGNGILALMVSSFTVGMIFVEICIYVVKMWKRWE